MWSVQYELGYLLNFYTIGYEILCYNPLDIKKKKVGLSFVDANLIKQGQESSPRRWVLSVVLKPNYRLSWISYGLS